MPSFEICGLIWAPLEAVIKIGTRNIIIVAALVMEKQTETTRTRIRGQILARKVTKAIIPIPLLTGANCRSSMLSWYLPKARDPYVAVTGPSSAELPPYVTLSTECALTLAAVD